MSAALPPILVDGPLLRGVDRAHRRAFFKKTEVRGYPGGDILFTEGDPGGEILFIAWGEVSIFQSTMNEEPVELARIRAGDFVGELSLLSPARRSATAIAETPTQVLKMTRETFFTQLRAQDPAARALLQTIAKRICPRIRTTDARIDLVHDALRGASPSSLEARLIALTGETNQGPYSWRTRLLSFFGGDL